ncbi:hypothetical protein KIN20_005253 [Parelaphostrongylus tenuis]|uniref:C2 domain-containing protein n=1 Tax=Parelaphostrongylus tenuis TaxID=148309 RepID=A0AAD5MI63_PARTN|nr:hypothetical protein KIN20_005253 [Parelaphostrongylus tenuis]
MFDVIEQCSSTPSVILLLTLRASKLRDRDVFSKSDPMCVVSQLVGRLTGNAHWRECGRTEQLQNTLDPEWSTQIRIEYFFEEKQTMRFEIYDIDSTSTELSAHDFLGRIECDLAEIVSNRPFRKALSGLKRNSGELIIWSDEIDEGSKEQVLFRLRAKKLDRKGLFRKSNPFMKLYRISDDGSRVLAHRTEAITRKLNPEWKPFEVNAKLLCNGDRSKPVLFECFDYHTNGSHSLIGSCQMSLDDLLTNEIKSKPLINEKKRERKGNKYKNSGTLEFDGIQILKQHSFLDFIAGGTQLDFAVAVDFTASNGAVHKPTSLHYINPAQPNQYEIAIRAVIDICQHYNNSKRFDAFGFGAILPPQTCVSPVFSLNFDANPAVVGLPGILEAYRFALNRVRLYGPTNFAPVIREISKKASCLPTNGSRYQILLIITDGAISDLAATKAAIISASILPLSIIIVGVGDAEFENMHELDSDDRALSQGGHTAQRDIVQFVPLRDILPQVCTGAESERAMGLLAKEVLAEIPKQLTSYMEKRNITPRPASDPFPKDDEAVYQPTLPPPLPYGVGSPHQKATSPRYSLPYGAGSPQQNVASPRYSLPYGAGSPQQIAASPRYSLPHVEPVGPTSMGYPAQQQGHYAYSPGYPSDLPHQSVTYQSYPAYPPTYAAPGLSHATSGSPQQINLKQTSSNVPTAPPID